LEETTKPYFNLSFDPALQLELQSATESSSKSVNSKAADIERRRQEELDKAFDNNKQTLEDQIDKVIKDKGWNIDNVLFHGGPKFDKFAKQFFQTGEYSDLDMRRIAESMGVRIPEGNFSFSVIPITALRYALKYGKNNPTIYIVNKTKSLGAKEITGNEEIEAQEWIIDADNISDVITVPLIPDANKINAKYDAELAALKQQPTSTTQPSTSVKSTLPGPDTKINIYAGTGENAELSNFANRPFSIKGQTFNTVEGAFQSAKLAFTNEYLATGKLRKGDQEIINELRVVSGAEAKKIGRKIEDLNSAEWDKVSLNRMKSFIKLSFEQNPDALEKLLATGNATLTHTQDKTKWGAEFPRLLMEVREELRGTQPSTSVKEGVSEQKVPKTSNSAKPISFQLDLASIGEAVANELKESIVNQGLGATFNIQESVDSKIAENINKGKQNSCK
jgi:predicted NAD-dependent protein-ADP-ribosyltransferase YbiA (DUF1768 family)